jgi:hypothetical protein
MHAKSVASVLFLKLDNGAPYWDGRTHEIGGVNNE